MKKSIIVILLVAVVAVAGAFYVSQILAGAKKVSSLDSLISEDVLFYAYSYNLDKKIKEFQASNFFNKFTKTTIYKIWLEPQLNQLYQNAPFLSGFLKEDVGLALFSLGNPQSLRGGIQDLGDFLILVRLDSKKRAQIQRQVFDTYLSLVNKGKGNVAFKTYTYNGVKISKYTSVKPAFSINYAFIADVLTLSNNANVIQRSIDLYQNKSKNNSLFANANFQKIKSRFPKDSWLCLYQNNEAYNRAMFEYYVSGALHSKSGRWAAYAANPAQLAPMLELMNIVKVSGFSFERDILKEGFLWRSFYMFGEPKSKAISEITKFITDRRVLKAEVLRLIPRDILLYMGVCRDIPSLWRFLKYSFTQMPQALAASSGQEPAFPAQEIEKGISDGLAKLDAFLGVSFEKDVLPAFGDNFGFVVVNLENTEINMPGPQAGVPLPGMGSLSIALPQAYSYLEVNDVPKIRALLEKVVRKLVEKTNLQLLERKKKWETLSQQQGAASAEKQVGLPAPEEGQPLTFLKDVYQEQEIFYIDLLNFPLAFFKPNYCFLDKYVIFSYSLPLTKKIIDNYKSKESSFARNLNFSSLKEKIPGEYSDIAFFDMKRTIEELKRVKFFDSFIYQMLISANPQGARKEEIEQVLSFLSDLVSIASVNISGGQDIAENYIYIKIQGL